MLGFWVVKLHRHVSRYQRFGRTYYLHIQRMFLRNFDPFFANMSVLVTDFLLLLYLLQPSSLFNNYCLFLFAYTFRLQSVFVPLVYNLL